MTRCDFDGVFHRVFCVTLLAIAFTFTVILTNVFIDIDGLLSTKEKVKIERIQIVPDSNVEINRDERMNRFEPQLFAEDFHHFEEDTEEPAYRTKRSLDSSDFQFHIKNPKIKKVLTNRLATLLEELDAEESRPNKLANERKEEENRVEDNGKGTGTDNVRIPDEKDVKKDSELLHLAMHNILLQGIIGHMDLGEAYRKVNTVVKRVNKNIDDSKKEKDQQNLKLEDNSKEPTTTPSSYNVESKFFDELVNCNELQQQIEEKSGQKIVLDRRSNKKRGGKMLIKTVIDITSLGSEKNKENNTNSSENIKGIIKLIYNGKSIKFIPMDDEKRTEKTDEIENILKPEDSQKNKNLEAPESLNENSDNPNIPKDIVNDALTEYFRKYQNLPKRFEGRKQFVGRPKRNVKVRGETTTEKFKRTTKKDDEELYVEIETHFDSKGMKGKKKKELIRSLVDKIQKAIHADIESLKDTKKKKKHTHIKKRIQNPLDKAERILQNKMGIAYKKVEHRELHPISKAVPVQETVPYMFDKTGQAWQKKYIGPHFLSNGKAINSGELGEVDLEYNNVLKSNGIPQRLQQPLNTETDTLDNTIFDLGNLNFVIKDLDGSGFSIGFNQYVGELPDPESVKFFTGLHELVNDYDDKIETATDVKEYSNERTEYDEQSHELKKRHIVRNKRHTNKNFNSDKDYHSNEYKIIFNNNFMPYDNYQDIIEGRSKNKIVYNKQNKNESYHHNPRNIKLRNNKKPLEDQPIIIDDDFLSRDLRPSEIFGLANLLNRKKRGLKVKKISKIKTKSNVRKYMPRTSQKIFIKKTNLRRNKRQIDKIRIIARDRAPGHSAEDIFVVSDENDFADGAIIRHLPVNNQEEHFEYGSPYDRQDYTSAIFSGRSRHNALMSKYPHVFLEEVSKPKDDSIETPFFNQYVDKTIESKREGIDNNSNLHEITDKNEEVNDANSNNYKITVKISPKNESMRAGFKEVHTSINKSISKNGLLYSSLVNVSEFSRIENVNKTDELSTLSPLVNHIKEQQERMKYLLRQHRLKIDEQLAHLQKEKQNLDSIITAKNIPNSSEMIDFVLPSNPPKLLHLTKKEAGELLSSAFMKLQSTPAHNNLDSTIPTTDSTTLLTATTIPTTIRTTTLDPEKVQIISTMQRSENLTNKILSKIDKNTELLQTFLQKLAERVESATIHEPKHDKPAKINRRADYREYIHDPFFMETMPNMEISKNETHVSFPFVYAYQQPYPFQNKPNTPIASVIYQGHIHTNTLQRNINHNNKESNEYKKPNRREIPSNQNTINVPMNHNNHHDLNVPQLNKREINMPQTQINQRDDKMPQVNKREINMPQSNQRSMPQINPRDKNIQKISQRDINTPNQIEGLAMPHRETIVMPQRENLVLPLNQTKFFIDGGNSNYKLMPVRNAVKQFISNNNSTNI